ncbi:MAG TPA: hypothetical protein G4N96_07645 [Chloroflexi bacterium]|nr:hypothetical protein [Chloroflexota bacterium]
MVIEIMDQRLIQQIGRIAATEQRAPEQIVADALRLYTTQPRKTSGVSFLLSIAGQGDSGVNDVSMRDEEILATEVDPARGWRVEREDENPA